MLLKLRLQVLVLFSLLSLAGCFEIDNAILTAKDGVALPGGPGVFFSIDKESGERKPVELLQGESGKHEYTISSKNEDAEFEGKILFHRVQDNRYIVQIQSSIDDPLMVVVAQITNDKLIFAELESDAFRQQLQTAGIPIVKKLLFSDNEEAKAEIAKLSAGGQTFAIDSIGFSLQGDSKKMLEIAVELAKTVNFGEDDVYLVLQRKP